MRQRRWGTGGTKREESGPQPGPRGAEMGSLRSLHARLARAEVELDQARFGKRLLESQLRRFVGEAEDRARRSEEERRRLSAHVQKLETTIRGINASKSWKFVSLLRRLAGRGW